MKIVLITGARCSGVAMVGVIVRFCGADGGHIPGFRNYDVRVLEQKPFDGRGPTFENAEIRNSVVKPLLQGAGFDTNGLDPLPNLEVCQVLAERLGPRWGRRVQGVLLSESGSTYDESTTYFYCSEQIAHLWPIWNAAFPEADWIIVRRESSEILGALEGAAYLRKALPFPEQRMSWLKYHEDAFAELSLAVRGGIHSVWPASFMNGDLAPIESVIRSCGLTWDAQGVGDLIAPLLWKSGRFE